MQHLAPCRTYRFRVRLGEGPDATKFKHIGFSTLPNKPDPPIIKQWTPVKGKYRTVTIVAGGAESYHRCTRRAKAAAERKQAADSLAGAPRSTNSISTTSFGSRAATGRLNPAKTYARQNDRITDLAPGWQYVVEAIELKDVSGEQVAAGGAEEAISAIEEGAWALPEVPGTPFPTHQKARKMVFDFNNLQANESYAFRVRVESQVSPTSTAGSTDSSAVASEYSDVMVCTAPNDFKGIKLAVPDPAKQRAVARAERNLLDEDAGDGAAGGSGGGSGGDGGGGGGDEMDEEVLGFASFLDDLEWMAAAGEQRERPHSLTLSSLTHHSVTPSPSPS